MTADSPTLSEGFQRLYCDGTVYDSFSTFHPISFARVLPFQPQDPVVDDDRLIGAEGAHLTDQNDLTRREVMDAYAQCGLLMGSEADTVKSVIDYFGADFFELMGLVYANAGIFICALRWYREFIRELESERRDSRSPMDDEGVHPSIGYCLYSLGLFEEAIAWTKSCIGPEQMTGAVCQALLRYEMKLAEGTVLAVESVGPRVRYTLSAPVDAGQAAEASTRLKAAMKAFAPWQEIYLDWVRPDTPRPEVQPDGYPFSVERLVGSLPRHKMNLLFATCAHAML